MGGFLKSHPYFYSKGNVGRQIILYTLVKEHTREQKFQSNKLEKEREGKKVYEEKEGKVYNCLSSGPENKGNRNTVIYVFDLLSIHGENFFGGHNDCPDLIKATCWEIRVLHTGSDENPHEDNLFIHTCSYLFINVLHCGQ